MFVDGENLTIRGQEFAKNNGIVLQEGKYYSRNVFVWLPGNDATWNPTYAPTTRIQLQPSAIRSYYYTSLTGDEDRMAEVRRSLWALGFNPRVYKKKIASQKAKGVDIALTIDMLKYAHLNNYDVAVLYAGDGDYIPLVEEIKSMGKVVYLGFFRKEGLNPELELSADQFFGLDNVFQISWTDYRVWLAKQDKEQAQT